MLLNGAWIETAASRREEMRIVRCSSLSHGNDVGSKLVGGRLMQQTYEQQQIVVYINCLATTAISTANCTQTLVSGTRDAAAWY